MKCSNVFNSKKVKAMVVALTFLSLSAVAQKQTDTLAQRLHTNDTQRLQWWRDARFGLFIHWGPCTLTGADISWSRGKELPVNIYDNLYKQFNPVNFDAKKWVQYAQDAGMKYIIFVAKHHDGFVMWDSKLTDYKITNTPFKRDVLRELSVAAQAAHMPLGIYFSPGDWHDSTCRSKIYNDIFVKKMHAYLTEVLTNYGPISHVWFDFDGLPNPSIPAETYALVRKLQPNAIVSNRLEAIMSDESHGFVGKWGDYATPENRVGSYCSDVPWETCETMGKGWPWRTDDKPKDLQRMLNVLTGCIGGDGNLLLNVGPNALGEFEPAFVDRMQQIGKWVHANDIAVYGTRGGPYMPTSEYACTRNGNKIFIHVKKFNHNEIRLPVFNSKIVKATMIDGTPIEVLQDKTAMILKVPNEKIDPNVTVIVLEIKGSAMGLAVIAPFTKSNSLAYYKSATVSSSVAPQFMHNAAAMFDDNDGTFWTPGRNPALADSISGYRFDRCYEPSLPVWQKRGWVEVDLGKTVKVARILIKEKKSANYSKVSFYKIEFDAKGKWETIASGTSVGDTISLAAPVIARKLKLSVEALGKPAISEFQVWGDR